MKIFILEGIACSGKTTIARMVAEKYPNTKIFTEGDTLMPLIENRDPQVAKSYLEQLLKKVRDAKEGNVDYLILDRFHLTHAFRTGSHLKIFSEIETELQKIGEVHMILLTIDPAHIQERIEETLEYRKGVWKKGARGTLEERVAYYTDQQMKLQTLFEESVLPKMSIDTTEKKWDEYTGALC